MFKVGDKVALVDSPNKLYGTVRRLYNTQDTETAIEIEVPIGGSHGLAIRRADNGHTLSPDGRKDWQVVPYIEPRPQIPKFVVVNARSGHHFVGDDLVFDGQVTDLKGNSTITLISGDAVYQYIGRIEIVQVMEEEEPIAPGYRWTTRNASPGYENEVIAIRGDYAFIQTYIGATPGRCTTMRMASIPKTKRPCNKFVKKLIKE